MKSSRLLTFLLITTICLLSGCSDCYDYSIQFSKLNPGNVETSNSIFLESFKPDFSLSFNKELNNRFTL